MNKSDDCTSISLRFKVASAADESKIKGFFKAQLIDLDLPFIEGVSDQDLNNLENLYSHRGLFMIVEHNGIIVGTGGLRESENQEIADLTKFYIAKDFQNDGLGSLVLDILLAQAKAFGYKSISLITNTKLSAADHLFKKRGFQSEIDQSTLPASCNLRMTLTLEGEH